MRSQRRRGYLDAVGVLVGEAVLFAFFVRAGGLLGTVQFAHFAAWSQSVGPERVLTALVRLLGLAVSAWLLGSTLVYLVAAMTGSRRLLESSRLITLPVLRRAIDALAVASVAASSIGAAANAGTWPGSVPAAMVVAGGPARQLAPSPAPVVMPGGGGERGVPVSATAVGRHFPHPGPAVHSLPGPRATVVPSEGNVPSAANGFAGLPAGTKVVVVQPGDCLSVIAERHLGDWRLDSEIEALNRGRLQPDGRALVDDHWIYPGWVLVMPKDAVGTFVVGVSERASAAAAAPARPAPGAAARRVHPTHWPSPPSEAGPGLHRGVPVTSPPSETGLPGPHREVPVASPSTGPGRPGAPAALPPPPGRAPAPSPRPTTGGPWATVVTTQPGRPVPDVHRGDGKRGEDGRPSVTSLDLAGVGALAAGGLIWRLDRARREQAHSRPRGRAFPRSRPPVEAAERRARAIADRDALSWVDLGLRYLSGQVEQLCLDGARSVPSLVLARVGGDGLEVVLSPSPVGRLGWFSNNAQGNALVLDADITLEDLKALAEERWPAWPALVSVGDIDGTTVLINLEHAGSLSVEGPPARVAAVLADFALQLASHPWCDEMLAGLYTTGDSPWPAQPAGLHHIEPPAALDLAEKFDRIGGAHQELAGELALSTLRAVACEALPNVAVAFSGTPPGALQCLAEAAIPERSGISVVGPGPFEGARWRLILAEAQRASLLGQIGPDPLHYELTMNCDLQEVALLSEALGATSDRDGAPVRDDPIAVTDALFDEGANRDEVNPAPAGSSEGTERGEVEIGILGPVDVAGGDLTALESSRRMAALAVLAYMAAHPRAVSADELAGNLWPLDATRDDIGGPQRKTVMNVISRARAVLGYGRGGKERLVYSSMGYRLSEDVTSDWGRFEHFVTAARRQRGPAAMASLRKALELVRGQPFGGAMSSQFFEWVASEHLDMTLSARVVDVAQDLGEMALDAGDLETVVWAVEKGLQLEPTREELFRLWMHALGRTGRPAKVDDVYRRLKLVLRQRIHPLQEPRLESREVWLSYTSAEVASTQG